MQEWWDQFELMLKRSDIKCRLRAIYVDDGRMIIQKIMPGTRYCKVSKQFIKKNEFIKEDMECDRESLTEREMKEAMCDVSSDLDFTTETEKDFPNKRLPTLSFQLWSEKEGVRHSYFEKDMRAQVLTMKRSSQSEQSKYSILVNELTRRFEVLDKNISLKEKCDIVDHYTQQLKNSGYSSEQIRDIVQSSLKGIVRKEINIGNREYRYRSGESTLEEREKKKTSRVKYMV